jgi:mono/diheme cytochrome c family protein
MVTFVWWQSDIRHFIGLFNVLVVLGIAGYLLFATLSRRKVEVEYKDAPNTVEFYADDVLEGRRLERVLGWSLIFVATFAVSFLVYLMREPVRQDHSETYFTELEIERGEVLFANAAGEAYNPVKSLACADCHGSEGGGGGKTVILDPDGPDGDLPPESHVWKVPPLNTVLLRFTQEPECTNPELKANASCEVSQIITYGRPGTPMPAFGVAGGGAKNEQAINDIVAFLSTIQLTPKEAKAQAAEQLVAARGEAGVQVTKAADDLKAKTDALAAARTDVVDKLGVPATTSDAAVESACDDIEATATENPDAVDEETRAQGKACRAWLKAVDDLATSQAASDWAEEWAARRENTSDGQRLFELFCARCHTEGWSIFDPTLPDSLEGLGLPGGGGGLGGGIGFNLRDGATVRRFGEDTLGHTTQSEFVANGSNAFAPYGRGGIGSGRMPGFVDMLTREQICLIVDYERNDLDSTTYGPEAKDQPSPRAPQVCEATESTTTTTEG